MFQNGFDDPKIYNDNLLKLDGIELEKFAEKIGSNLVYINQLENCKRKPTTDMLDKLANGINKLDKSLNITASDLLKYDPSHKTNFSRIDEKK